MQTAALIEGSFTFDAPRTIALLSIVQRFDYASAIVFVRDRLGLSEAPPAARNICTAPVSLRI
jgi:hypothetical protein